MTREEYGEWYEKKFNTTASLLLKKGLCRSREGAIRVAQEAWTKGWGKRDQLRNPEQVGTWVGRIAINIALVQIRRKKIIDEESVLNFDIVEAPTCILDDQIDAQTMISLCPKKYRKILVLHYIEGMTLEEMAELSGEPLTTIRSRVHQTLEVVRASLARRRYASSRKK